MANPETNDRYKRQRWLDFRRRADFSPKSVYKHRGHGWEYISIHPFGDELELLATLKVSPEDCQTVDAWWGIDGDATLLQASTCRISNRPPCLFAQPTSHDEQWVYLIAIFEAKCITRPMFEDAMEHFAVSGFPHDSRFRLKDGDPWLAL